MKHLARWSCGITTRASRPDPEVPGPAEIRGLAPDHHYAFTAAALTSKLIGIFRKPDGSFEAVEIADIGDPKQTPLPVDISLSADDKRLFVDTFMDGKVRVFDVSQPRAPKQIYGKVGPQVVWFRSPDGKRPTSHDPLARGRPAATTRTSRSSAGTEAAAPRFEIDFQKQQLGRPHIMNFGQKGLYKTVARAGEDG
jgi:selenium-binding protein 1